MAPSSKSPFPERKKKIKLNKIRIPNHLPMMFRMEENEKQSNASSRSWIEQIRLGIVCCSWRRIVKEYIPLSEAIPWLMFPLKPEEDGCCFYSVDEGKFYLQLQRKSVFRDFGRRHCIGSSHGWLVLLDERLNPYLLNPFLLYPDSPFSSRNFSGC